MKPLDPRLVRRTRGTRWFLVGGAGLAVVQAAATVAFAWALASTVAVLVAGDASGEASGWLLMLAGAACVRALAAWGWEATSSSAALRVKGELRSELLAAVGRRPGGIRNASTARLTTLLGPGLDALDDYFGAYLPQLVLTAVATPVFLVAAWLADPLSGLILTIVLPLIPVFMALIGMATQQVQRRQWEGLASLSRAFLEVLGGLSTLVLYGRAARQAQRIRAVTDDYRRRTMRVLGVTFLSGFTLELAASLSVALVAVTVGLRLVSGEVTLLPGLFVLVLAPEVFLPLRNVGAAFHSSAAGVEASQDAFEVLETAADPAAPEAAGGRRAGWGAARDRLDRAAAGTTDATPSSRRILPVDLGLTVADLVVRRGDRTVVDGLTLNVRPGEFVAVTGPSGVGKSSLIAALLGAVVFEGRIGLDGATRPDDVRARLAWAGQSPTLLAGTIADNVRLGDEAADEWVLERSLRLAGVELDASVELGPGGSGVSGGQAQRIATARAVHRLLVRDTALLVLDEPTSALDVEREAHLAASLRELTAKGHAVLVATHRPALAAAADRVVELEAAHV
ncbi:thiol reductant ABC exporter subunit CydD [Agromyces intestinalis]|uniref:Thiol reductant ABC exporter subunit CydD n=1 Tax=Agromyces intestinalis TaxID=2592652 RepID=A0A5C1YCS8_9MICO|nr:thiol reductant ABC exporter subunit CydD [Agromyces intestinalis]QEO13165.1 thiol reductant ABC exporter subunit CydD [Agromyces intestinalis]